MKTCSRKNSLLQLNIESKRLHNVMRFSDFESIIWPKLSIIGLSNISITCSCSMTSVSGEKALIFKACVRYFLSNIYFSPNDSPSKTMKNVFLFHQKSSSFQTYSNFRVPLFFSLSPIALEVDPRKILKFAIPSTAQIRG